jgi:hypothetical protein
VNSLNQKIDMSVRKNPFQLQNEAEYQQWRTQKLHNYLIDIINIKDISNLTPSDINALISACRKTNMVMYQTTPGVDKDSIRAMAAQLGLHRLDPNLLADDDGITSLQIVGYKNHRGYIPYSSKRLLWHTDGYYNKLEHRINAFVLHCVMPAEEGGDNALLDPEIAYLFMRDENPDFIAALMHPQALTIPANTEDLQHGRTEQTGPVFSVDNVTGSLYMRYTARTRSITWRNDETTRKAISWLDEFLNDTENAYIFRRKLASGQGILCNNVLHSRSGFDEDSDSKRLLYRARYYDRINDTELSARPQG